jgi:hypothetical protein
MHCASCQAEEAFLGTLGVTQICAACMLMGRIQINSLNQIVFCGRGPVPIPIISEFFNETVAAQKEIALWRSILGLWQLANQKEIN